MKGCRAIGLFLFLSLFASGAWAGGDADCYVNPLPIDIADPAVLHSGNTYYLYGTTDTAQGFRCWSSPDLVHWQARGFVYRKSDLTWGRDHFWAPCVIENDGKFYLFYSAIGPAKARWGHRICVARADSPLGPFIDLKAPLLDIDQSVIDAEVFTDADGRSYLYYALDVSENPVSEVFVVPLAADLASLAGPPTRCIRPSQRWEGARWNEAPCVFRHGDTYVLMYSANGYFDPRYAVGYATAPSPLGPWKKSEDNPILRGTAEVSGPGHNCLAPSPDGSELFILYHEHKSLSGGNPRQLALDRLRIEDGAGGTVRLSTDGPTRTPRPLPARLPTSRPLQAALQP